MSEQSMWHRLKDRFGRFGHWQRIEDALSMGIPDVNYCVAGVEGWIELKEIEHWPRSKYTPVRFRWELEQRIWARRRGRAGGNVWLLLKVKEEDSWLLFWWEDAASDDFGKEWVRKTICGRATIYAKRRAIDRDDFLFALSRGLYTKETGSDTPSTPSN